jgi:hypothetical protein
MKLRRHPIGARAVLRHGIVDGSRAVEHLVFGNTSRYKHYAELRDVHTALQKASIKVEVRGSGLQFTDGSSSYIYKADPFAQPKESFRGPDIQRATPQLSEVLIVTINLEYPDKSTQGQDTLTLHLAP